MYVLYTIFYHNLLKKICNFQKIKDITVFNDHVPVDTLLTIRLSHLVVCLINMAPIVWDRSQRWGLPKTRHISDGTS